MTRGWQDIPGIVCPHCPSNNQVSLLKFTNNILKKKMASALIGHFLMRSRLRRKNNDVLLHWQACASALAAAESNVGKERKINDDLKEKFAAAESNVGKELKINDDLKEKFAAAESNVGKELKINDDLKEKLAAAEANYEQSESKISAAKEAAASELAEERLERSLLAREMGQKIVILGSAASDMRAELAKERQKNDELKKKLVATQKIAFEHAVFTAGFKDEMRHVGLDILKNPLCLFWGKDSITDVAIHLVKHAYWRLDATSLLVKN